MGVSAVTVEELYEETHHSQAPSKELKKMETFLDPALAVH